MKKQWMILGLAVTFATGLYVGNTVLASTDGAEPGSIDDPIVTKSYVDEKAMLIQTSLEQQILKIIPQAAGGTSLQVVALKPGQQLIGFEGTEFIVRTGKVYAIGSAGGGIPNITAGADIADAKLVPLNNMLLFPRSDNRGVRFDAQSKGTAVIMVRGQYEVRNADGTLVPKG